MGQNTKNRLLMPDINNCLALWLILASLVDMGCDMKIDIL